MIDNITDKYLIEEKGGVSNELVSSFYGVSDNLSTLIKELKKAGMTKELKHVMEASKHIDMTKLGNIL